MHSTVEPPPSPEPRLCLVIPPPAVRRTRLANVPSHAGHSIGNVSPVSELVALRGTSMIPGETLKLCHVPQCL